MPILTYRCGGQCEGNPIFDSEDGICPECHTHGIQQMANPSNDDRAPGWVDAKPETSSVTGELSGELIGANQRPAPTIPVVTIPDFGGAKDGRSNT